jgi:hypothetical protein
MKYEVSYIRKTRIFAHVEADSKEDAFYKVDFMALEESPSKSHEVAILGPTKVKVRKIK